MILIVDFGSQTTHLISRRIGELGVKSAIINPEEALPEIKNLKPKGIILSGGPSSVYEKNAPRVERKIFQLRIPILGICYGLQLIAYLSRGRVERLPIREYGPKKIEIKNLKLEITKNLPFSSTVWMSHGDTVVKIPKDFQIIGSTDKVKAAFIGDIKRKIYGVQFHPEVQHTDYGMEILKNFLNICGERSQVSEIDINRIIKNIQEIVGDKKVIMAFSGGTDSFVAATLIFKAIGKNLIPVFVDSGLMREKLLNNVAKIFPKMFKIKPKVRKAKKM